MTLGYEEPKGNLYLREKISEYLKEHGVYVSPDSILIVSGAIQAAQLISMGLLSKGASILLEKPSYLYSLNVFQSAGVRLIESQWMKAGYIHHILRNIRSNLMPLFYIQSRLFIIQRTLV